MSSASAVNNNDVCEAERRRPPFSQRKKKQTCLWCDKEQQTSHEAAGGKKSNGQMRAEEKRSFFWKEQKNEETLSRRRWRFDGYSLICCISVPHHDDGTKFAGVFLDIIRKSAVWVKKRTRKPLKEKVKLQKLMLMWWLMMTWRDQFTKISQHSRNNAKVRSISPTGACFQSSHEVTSGHFTLVSPHLVRFRMKCFGSITVYHLKTPHGSAGRSIQPGY